MAVTLVASAGFQISSYRSARQMERIGNRAAHVRDVLTALAALRTAVQDAAIGRDGYALTGALDDLKLYHNAAAIVPPLVGQVRALTADDAAQSELASRLPSLCEEALQELESRPRAVDGQVRQVIDRMIEAEQQIRAECLSQTRAMASAQARSLIAASIYRVFVLLAGCSLILHQQARQRRTERMCRQQEEFFRNAFDHAATGMALADEGGRWVKANLALCELLGYAEAELLPIAPTSIAPLEDLDKQRAAADELRAGRTDRHQLEMRYVHKDGRTVWALVTTSLVRDENGRPQTFISQIQDVTERRRAENRLRHQSRHDALTGLPNRLLLEERLRQGIERANQDPDYRLAVLFLDLDRFKQINDTLGHAAGDKLLVTVAERLRRCVRGGDLVTGNASVDAADEDAGGAGHTVARLAGDEFTIVLDGLRTPDEADRVAERILRELDLPVEFGGQQIRAAASIGIVHAVGRCYTTAAQLMADADAALYKAKAGGRGRFVVFDADAQQSAIERLRLAGELRRAIELGQFVLHYQPIVSLLDGQVTGFQAMLRWDHPERGLLLPEQFLDLAEETGLAESLGDWVLQQGSRQLADWKKRYPRHWPSQSVRGLPTSPVDQGMFMIVAISGKWLADPALIHRVRALQQERQDALGHGWLRVTVAEPALMQDADAVNKILAELRSAGVRIWVDNFGSGVTSLECMRSTALDGLKIDGRVVGSAAGRRDYAAVLYSVLELARNLQLQVVADGLETAEQVMMLQAMGCDLGQGSYFGRPMPASEAETMLEARASAVPALSA